MPRALRLALVAIAAIFSLATSKFAAYKVVQTAPAQGAQVRPDVKLRVELDEVAGGNMKISDRHWKLQREGDTTPVAIDVQLHNASNNRVAGQPVAFDITPRAPLAPGVWRLSAVEKNPEVSWSPSGTTYLEFVVVASP